MIHKLREVMGKRDEEYQLANVIELDEGFFSTITSDETIKTRQRQSEKEQSIGHG